MYSSIAQSVEHSAVNRSVVGSSPTWGVKTLESMITRHFLKEIYSRHLVCIREFKDFCIKFKVLNFVLVAKRF